MLFLVIVLAVVAVGAIGYLFYTQRAKAPTNTGANTGRAPMPANPMGGYGFGPGGVGPGNLPLGYSPMANPGVDPNLQAGLGFASSTIGSIGNVFSSLAKAGVFGGGDDD